jgi:N-methylhydantoinase A
MLESGPAGGGLATAFFGAAAGKPEVISFDMGGTTAKACVVIDGRPSLARDYFIGSYNDGLPIHIPVLDIEEIGTGGGSIASIDEGESLRVGPRSAGAVPGPACYGRGGTEPTITDAHLVLGRLGPESMMGGRMSLDVDAARRAMRASVGERLGLEAEHVASGIIEIANGAMANAIRAVTLDQGMDPRDFVLVAYGGAGALHAAELARELGIREVVIPPTPGHFSARGMLSADLRRDVAITHFAPLADLDPEAMARIFGTIEVEGRDWFDSRGLHGDDVETVRSIDMRYVGQEHSVTIPVSAEDGGILPPERIKQAFDLLHDRMFGHAAPDETVECVTFRSSLVWPTEKVTSTAGDTGHEPGRPSGPKPGRQGMFHHSEGWVALEVLDRRSLPSDVAIVGPAVVEEDATSTLVPPGAWVSVGSLGELRIRFGSGPTTGKEQ